MWIDNFYDLLFYQGGIGWRCYIKIVHVPFGISSTVEIRFINTLYIALEAARDLNYLGKYLVFYHQDGCSWPLFVNFLQSFVERIAVFVQTLIIKTDSLSINISNCFARCKCSIGFRGDLMCKSILVIS